MKCANMSRSVIPLLIGIQPYFQLPNFLKWAYSAVARLTVIVFFNSAIFPSCSSVVLDQCEFFYRNGLFVDLFVLIKQYLNMAWYWICMNSFVMLRRLWLVICCQNWYSIDDVEGLICSWCHRPSVSFSRACPVGR